MQRMLNICTDFGIEYDFKFNENKSVDLRIGPRFNSVCKPLVLSGRCLQFVDSVKFALLLRTVLNALLRSSN